MLFVKGEIIMKELNYIRQGDYQFPDLKMTEQPNQTLSKIRRMRRDYLKQHHAIVYETMKIQETLFPHLLEVELPRIGE